MPRKVADNRTKFISEMDELAFTLAGATKRLPSSMFTEKVDAFKALTGYANTINRTPAQEEGNAIDQFRKELGLGAGNSGGGGVAGPTAASDDDDPDDDAEDGAGDDLDADNDTADTDGTALPEPSAGVSGAGNGAGGSVDGATFAALRHSVGLPRDK
jgi:hypothetical protein